MFELLGRRLAVDLIDHVGQTAAGALVIPDQLGKHRVGHLGGCRGTGPRDRSQRQDPILAGSIRRDRPVGRHAGHPGRAHVAVDDLELAGPGPCVDETDSVFVDVILARGPGGQGDRARRSSLGGPAVRPALLPAAADAVDLIRQCLQRVIVRSGSSHPSLSAIRRG